MHVEFQSIDPSRNRYRFYSLTVEDGLFWSNLVCRRGRIGGPTYTRTIELDGTREQLRRMLRQVLLRRRQHGYYVTHVDPELQGLIIGELGFRYGRRRTKCPTS